MRFNLRAAAHEKLDPTDLSVRLSQIAIQRQRPLVLSNRLRSAVRSH
jgi:hypothetical protein